MSTLFAYVKFTSGETDVVSIARIKQFDEATHTKQKVYQVFWSKNKEETPESIENRMGHEPHNIDDLIKQSGGKDTDKYMSEAGYYYCTVLAYKPTEKEINDFIQSRRGKSVKYARSNLPVSETLEEVPDVSAAGKKRAHEAKMREANKLSMMTVLDLDGSKSPKKKRKCVERKEKEQDTVDDIYARVSVGDSDSEDFSEVDDEDADSDYVFNEDVQKQRYRVVMELRGNVSGIDGKNSVEPPDSIEDSGKVQHSKPKGKSSDSIVDPCGATEEVVMIGSPAKEGNSEHIRKSNIYDFNEDDVVPMSSEMLRKAKEDSPSSRQNLMSRIKDLESQLKTYQSLDFDNFQFNFNVLERKYANLEKEKKQLETENINLRKNLDDLNLEYREVVKRNLSFQDALIKICEKNQSSRHFEAGLSTENHSFSTISLSANVIDSSSPTFTAVSPLPKSPSPSSSAKLPSATSSPNSFNNCYAAPQVSPQTSESPISIVESGPPISDSSIAEEMRHKNVSDVNVDNDASASAENSLEVERILFNRVLHKVYKGSENYTLLDLNNFEKFCRAASKERGTGDSWFVRKVTEKVFTDEVLSKSTVSGETRGKKGKKSKLDEEGVEYIEVLLGRRVLSGLNATLTDNEKSKAIYSRCEHTKKFIGLKINTILRKTGVSAALQQNNEESTEDNESET